MLLKSYWAGVTGTERERCFVMLQRRLIRKLLTLLVNLINFIILEESPDYIWKIADNPNSQLWVIWYKTTQVYGYMATAHFADFWVRVMTKTWAERAAQYPQGRKCLVLVSWEEVPMISGSKWGRCHGRRLTGCPLFRLSKLGLEITFPRLLFAKAYLLALCLNSTLQY